MKGKRGLIKDCYIDFLDDLMYACFDEFGKRSELDNLLVF